MDRPGILSEILDKFSEKNINLKAILSRPDKTMMGRYNFYIEFGLSLDEKKGFYELLDSFRNNNDFKIQVLGIYEAI